MIGCGGGGIPVFFENDRYIGVEAVIDKDYSSAKLGNQLKAEYLFILTDVPYVFRNFGKPEQEPIARMTRKEAQAFLMANEFSEGSMKPKVEACLDFLNGGGKKAIITSVEEIGNALEGKSGTVVE